jgi:hypothetical protein
MDDAPVLGLKRAPNTGVAAGLSYALRAFYAVKRRLKLIAATLTFTQGMKRTLIELSNTVSTVRN